MQICILPSLQTACIYLKQGAIFSLTAHSGPDLTVTHLLFALGKEQRVDLQNKLDTKAEILFLNSPVNISIYLHQHHNKQNIRNF